MSCGRIPNEATLAWLLDRTNPTVRYLTMTRLMGVSETDPEVLETRHAIMATGPVPELLAGQSTAGYWGKPDRLYTDKYHGTAWRLLILAELCADGSHPAVQAACEFILTHSQETTDGGFAMHTSAKAGGGRASEVIPCLTGNMVYSLIQLGYGDDPRVRRGIDWIVRFQRFDDGIDQAPHGSIYDRYEVCFGKHSCHMGVVKALKALAVVPVAKRSGDINSTISRGIEYLLAHHLYRRSHDLSKVAKQGWLRFGFPLMYQTDVLEILDILASLGCRDPRMKDALAVVDAKQGTDGRWKVDSALESGRLPARFEVKGEPSKWITLRALHMQKLLATSA